MKSGLKNNLVLAGLFVVLAAFAYWFEFKKKVEIDKKNDAKTKIFAFDTNTEFSSVHVVEKNSKVDFTFICSGKCRMSDSGSNWKITSPFTFKADDGNITSFISNISNAMVSEKIPLEGEIKADGFGITPEKKNDFKVEITVKGSDKPYTVYFGDQAAVGENLYAQVDRPDHSDSQNILIVPGYLKASIQKELNHWRSKRIFEFTQTDIDSFVLNSKTKIFKKEGMWFCKEGNSPDILGDSETIDAFVTGLVFMNAYNYVSDNREQDASKFNIKGTPVQNIEISLKDQKKLKLNLYTQKKDKEVRIFATLSDQKYILELDKSSTEKFNKGLKFFKFRRLITVAEKQQTKKIKITLAGKDQYEIEKSAEGSWIESKSSIHKIEGFDSKKFDESVNKIGTAVVAEFLADPKIPTHAKEVAEWQFFDENSKLIRSFKAYTIDSGMMVKLQTGDIAKMEGGPLNQVPFEKSDFTAAPKK